jgi:hypothetical protein
MWRKGKKITGIFKNELQLQKWFQYFLSAPGKMSKHMDIMDRQENIRGSNNRGWFLIQHPSCVSDPFCSDN